MVLNQYIQLVCRNNSRAFIGFRVVILFLSIASTMAGPISAQLPILNPTTISKSSDTASIPVVTIELIPEYQYLTNSMDLGIAIVLGIPDGWHLYANPKRGEFGLDTEIVLPTIPGLQFGTVQYPEGTFYKDETLDASNYIYTGRTVCFLSVRTTEQTGLFTIPVEFKGQLCSDSGTCRLWNEKKTFTLEVQPNAAPRKTERLDLFVGYQPDKAWAVDSAPGKESTAIPPKEQLEGWIKPILLAVAAGLIMNLMPCVLPLIPIIVLTLLKQCAAEEGQAADRRKSIRTGLAFAGGILLVFAALAVVMSVFKLIWGQQFQGSGFKFTLLMIVYVLSLSMFGLFEIVLPAKVTNISVVRKGYAGTVGMGMLTTVLATPCGAPLLTGVLAWSLAKPLPVTIAVFLIIGAGMASPYVLLTAFPGLMNRIPKAGSWMLRLKQLIGFLMLGFVVYLITLFPPGWHGLLMYYCVAVGLCVWLAFGVAGPASSRRKKYVLRVLALLLLAVASMGLMKAPKTATGTTGESWDSQRFHYLQQGRNVMVKFTANWCKNCAVLDKLIYKQKIFQDKLQQTDTSLVVADWSYDDPKIETMIRELGGEGQALPFAAVFPAKDPNHPILLRDFYSLQDAIAALEQAKNR